MTTEERLEALEKELAWEKRRNRRWIIGILVVAGAGLVAGAVGMAPMVKEWVKEKDYGPKVIRANQFIVEDEKGMERASLLLNREGPWLKLIDDNGTARAMFRVQKNEPWLMMADEKGHVRAGMGIEAGKPAKVNMWDEKGNVVWSAPGAEK